MCMCCWTECIRWGQVPTPQSQGTWKGPLVSNIQLNKTGDKDKLNVTEFRKDVRFIFREIEKLKHHSEDRNKKWDTIFFKYFLLFYCLVILPATYTLIRFSHLHEICCSQAIGDARVWSTLDIVIGFFYLYGDKQRSAEGWLSDGGNLRRQGRSSVPFNNLHWDFRFSILKVGAVYSSEKLVSTCKSTRRYSP
jgi:hypothetical protein